MPYAEHVHIMQKTLFSQWFWRFCRKRYFLHIRAGSFPLRAGLFFGTAEEMHYLLVFTRFPNVRGHSQRGGFSFGSPSRRGRPAHQPQKMLFSQWFSTISRETLGFRARFFLGTAEETQLLLVFTRFPNVLVDPQRDGFLFGSPSRRGRPARLPQKMLFSHWFSTILRETLRFRVGSFLWHS